MRQGRLLLSPLVAIESPHRQESAQQFQLELDKIQQYFRNTLWMQPKNRNRQMAPTLTPRATLTACGLTLRGWHRRELFPAHMDVLDHFDAVFIGRTNFCTTNLGIWYFSVRNLFTV